MDFFKLSQKTKLFVSESKKSCGSIDYMLCLIVKLSMGKLRVRNKIKIIYKLICCLLIISLVQCGSPSEPLSETDNTRAGEAVENPLSAENGSDPVENDPPYTGDERAPIENDPPSAGDERADTETDSTEPFVSNECNRFYWTFKCALEYKTTQAHSEQCESNIKAVYPNDENRMNRISAQSKNSEHVIKTTWSNYFNQNCKNDISVTENLKNLD